MHQTKPNVMSFRETGTDASASKTFCKFARSSLHKIPSHDTSTRSYFAVPPNWHALPSLIHTWAGLSRPGRVLRLLMKEEMSPKLDQQCFESCSAGYLIASLRETMITPQAWNLWSEHQRSHGSSASMTEDMDCSISLSSVVAKIG